MELTQETINNNKERFKKILSSIKRDGVSDILEYLETTDFYEAPASTKYHNNIKGGLCAHCLNVYDNLCLLKDIFYSDLEEESIVLTSLLHDISKANYYELYIQNVKEYSSSGRLSDDNGQFNWVQVKKYKVRDEMNRDNVYSEHGVCSFIIVNKFVRLNADEIAAIVNHHMGMDTGNIRPDISEIYDRYPLASLLHTADLLSTYIDENKYKIN